MGPGSDYLEVLAAVGNAILKTGEKTFKRKYTKLKQENEETVNIINGYLDYICQFQINFTKEVLTDFRLNRKHDRTTKKLMVAFMFFIFSIFFLGTILVAVAYLCGWGVVDRLDTLFKVSIFGTIVGGAVTLFTIIFKYIFNKKEDIFYKYSVDLFKHIVSDKKYITDSNRKAYNSKANEEENSDSEADKQRKI